MNKRIHQQTIASPCTIHGIGLHTGAEVSLTIEPASPNSGIKFHRTDLGDDAVIKADVDFVVETARGTTIEHNQVRVQTIEHLLAALVGCGVDNALIKLNAAEVPILDGSAAGFVELITKAGVQEQDAHVVYYSIDENLMYEDKQRNVKLLALPNDHYEVTTLIDFNSPVLGTQHAILKDITQFNKEIAPSRTFCFLHELEQLVQHNLIKGGDLNNAIVIADKEVSADTLQRLATIFNKPDVKVEKEGILNNLELHYPNEPARHKLLDVVGDLALSGYHINAHIIATRPGHEANVAFAKVIKNYIKKNKNQAEIPCYDPSVEPVYDINYISKTLPHKYPFLLVDKIIEMSEKHVVGIKNVTMNEHFFQGHFPNNPVMPGVLQIEAMAQAGGILALNNIPNAEDYDTYFLKIDKVKFKQKVIPGDTLILKLELLAPIRRGICEMSAIAYVGKKVVTEAVLVAQIVQRNK